MKDAGKGFTLIELAVVLVIIGLIMSAGAELLPMLVKQSRFKENQIIVRSTRDAILGYLLATGRLPCAAAANNGVATANNFRGYVPWSTLGISGRDAYGNVMFYAVHQNLTLNTTNLSNLKSVVQPLVTASNLTLGTGASTIRVAFLVISAGENRRADSPNDDNNDSRIRQAGDNNQFAHPTTARNATYDDILECEQSSNLYLLAP